MESISIRKRKTEKAKTKSTENLDNIIQEYCLKRNQTLSCFSGRGKKVSDLLKFLPS